MPAAGIVPASRAAFVTTRSMVFPLMATGLDRITAAMSRLAITAFLLAAVAAAGQARAGDLPDRGMTPGGVASTDLRKVCKRAYVKSFKPVPPDVVAQVYKEYGIQHPDPTDYEIDQLVSLDLGGSNDIFNLWPQSTRTRPWNAQLKNRLEKRLRQLVCTGKLSLVEAQSALATDWTAAYERWIGDPPK
jgi:hypothetical protein